MIRIYVNDNSTKLYKRQHSLSTGTTLNYNRNCQIKTAVLVM